MRGLHCLAGPPPALSLCLEPNNMLRKFEGEALANFYEETREVRMSKIAGYEGGMEVGTALSLVIWLERARGQ